MTPKVAATVQLPQVLARPVLICVADGLGHGLADRDPSSLHLPFILAVAIDHRGRLVFLAELIVIGLYQQYAALGLLARQFWPLSS